MWFEDDVVLGLVGFAPLATPNTAIVVKKFTNDKRLEAPLVFFTP